MIIGAKMKGRSKHSKEFREKIAQEAITTSNTKSVADKYSLNPQTVYSWVKTFKNKEKNQAKKTIKQLEQELADKELENKILKELLKKTTQTLIKD